MSDDRLRTAERAWRESRDDEREVRYLRELLRVGRLDARRLELAALLEHEPARAVLGAAPAEGLEAPAWIERTAALVAETGPDVALRVAIAVARSVPVHGDRFDGPDDEAMQVLEALDRIAAADPAARPARVAQAQGALVERWGGGVGNVAATAFALVLEPENTPTLLQGLLDHATAYLGLRDVRAGLREDLARWLAGLEDPVRDRAAGKRFATDPSISRAIAFSPDARLVATACFSGDVTLRDAATGAAERVLRHRPRDVHAAAFAPDGARVVAGDLDGRLIAWDLATGQETVWEAHEGGVSALDVLPDGRVASVGDDALRLWSPDGTRGLSLEDRHGLAGARLRALARSPDGSLVATLAARRLTLWDLAAEAPRWSVDHPASATDLAWSGERLLTIDEAGVLRRWRASDGELVDELRVHDRGGYALAVSPSGHLAATAHDRAVVVTDLLDGVVQRSIRLPGVQLAVAFAPDGRWFLVGARTGALRRYDV